MATLHHQIVYMLQDHSLDLPSQGLRDPPLILADSGTDVPTIGQIPRQISRRDLEKLVPTEWITNYETLHQAHEAVRATDFQIKRCEISKKKEEKDGEKEGREERCVY